MAWIIITTGYFGEWQHQTSSTLAGGNGGGNGISSRQSLFLPATSAVNWSKADRVTSCLCDVAR